ncbi:MAG: hypothetical protein BWY19_01125 [bacterium ADurb.Bin212]|nr:MAG: hypothetical protein BWY19_01125 [bacterium ADurb.Bin212]
MSKRDEISEDIIQKESIEWAKFLYRLYQDKKIRDMVMKSDEREE